MDSKLLVGLIKEVVKNEVKQQVKEELAKLIKSGAVTLNKERKQPSLMEMTEVKPIQREKIQIPAPNQPIPKQLTKNPILNEVLSQTAPFTAAQRAEGGMPGVTGGSILDAIQPQRTMEEDWETMSYSTEMMPQQQIPTTDNAGLDALTKALTRDYSALTKVFAKQEKEKKGR